MEANTARSTQCIEHVLISFTKKIKLDRVSCSVIVRVRVVLKRTVVGDSD